MIHLSKLTSSEAVSSKRSILSAVMAFRFMAVAFIAFAIAAPFIWRPFRVAGGSMQTTLASGDIVLVDMYSLRIVPPHRGEMIVFRNPRGKSDGATIENDVKRIIGLPGETVRVRRTGVVIGRACDAAGNALAPARTEIAAVDGPCQTTYDGSTLVGGGRNGSNNNEFDMFLGPLDYFVMGDNRIGSLDSRQFGTVQPEYFIGRVILRL